MCCVQARVKQKHQAQALAEGPDELAGVNDEDNELYEEVKESKKRKKAAKDAKYGAAPARAPAEDEVVAGPRKVTREVDQNRGLTPHRRKDMKNPRVKVRLHFAAGSQVSLLYVRVVMV